MRGINPIQSLHIIMNFIHSGSMIQYPPFDALIAFEAAARLGNMTLAADELGVTQSAVSHRIRRLEAYMGASLLMRNNSGLEVTSAGKTLMGGLKGVLEGMQELRGLCLAETTDQLRVGVGAALADNWLVKRLVDFTKTHQNIPIELIVVENEAPERIGDLDVRILWLPSSEVKSTSTQKPLFRENVFPVCHPSLLPDNFEPGDGQILETLPLLFKGKVGHYAGTEWAWETWFTRLNLTSTPKPTLRFTSLGPALSATSQAAGAVLARSLLVYDALNEGRLVRLLPPSYDMLSDKVHVARWPARLTGDKRVKALVKWLVEQSNEMSDKLKP